MILSPNIPRSKAIAILSTRGEEIKNAKITPSGIPAFKKPIKIGIDEQLQNGVIVPKIEAKK